MHISSNTIITSPEEYTNTGAHLFWQNKPDESLINSMKTFGQTTPVLAMQNGDKYELIAGFSRHAVAALTNSPLLARLVDNANAIEKGLLYLADNAHRTLDDGMRLSALCYFAPMLKDQELRELVYPPLNIRPKSKDAQLFTHWATLPAIWQNHLTAGRIPLASGTILKSMNTGDLEAVAPFFETYSWSRSNAVNLLTWLFETAKMTGSTISDVMETPELTSLNAQNLSPKDAMSKIISVVKRIRYPHLSALQDTFTRAAQELTAGTSWRMNQPNNFETGGAELSIQIKSPEQLAKAIEELKAMSDLSPWKSLWTLGGKNV